MTPANVALRVAATPLPVLVWAGMQAWPWPPLAGLILTLVASMQWAIWVAVPHPRARRLIASWAPMIVAAILHWTPFTGPAPALGFAVATATLWTFHLWRPSARAGGDDSPVEDAAGNGQDTTDDPDKRTEDEPVAWTDRLPGARPAVLLGGVAAVIAAAAATTLPATTPERLGTLAVSLGVVAWIGSRNPIAGGIAASWWFLAGVVHGATIAGSGVADHPLVAVGLGAVLCAWVAATIVPTAAATLRPDTPPTEPVWRESEPVPAVPDRAPEPRPIDPHHLVPYSAHGMGAGPLRFEDDDSHAEAVELPFTHRVAALFPERRRTDAGVVSLDDIVTHCAPITRTEATNALADEGVPVERETGVRPLAGGTSSAKLAVRWGALPEGARATPCATPREGADLRR